MRVVASMHRGGDLQHDRDSGAVQSGAAGHLRFRLTVSIGRAVVMAGVRHIRGHLVTRTHVPGVHDQHWSKSKLGPCRYADQQRQRN